MTDRVDTYDVSDGPHVALFLHGGHVRVRRGDQGRVTIALSGSEEALASVDIDETPDGVTVRSTGKRRRWFSGGLVDAVLSIPEDSDVTIHLGTGDILLSLPVRDLEVHSGSGDLRTDVVNGVAQVKVGSGDIRMGTISGAARIGSASGDVRIDKAHEITASTGSGDLYLGEITDVARIKSAAGDVRIERYDGPDLEVKTMSGDCTVGLPAGMVVNAAIKTLSGDFRNRIKPSQKAKTGTMNISITSFAGDVTLKSAR